MFHYLSNQTENSQSKNSLYLSLRDKIPIDLIIVLITGTIFTTTIAILSLYSTGGGAMWLKISSAEMGVGLLLSSIIQGVLFYQKKKPENSDVSSLLSNTGSSLQRTSFSLTESSESDFSISSSSSQTYCDWQISSAPESNDSDDIDDRNFRWGDTEEIRSGAPDSPLIEPRFKRPLRFIRLEGTPEERREQGLPSDSELEESVYNRLIFSSSEAGMKAEG